MISFAKAHGNGNDFIIIENIEGTYSNDGLSDLAKRYVAERLLWAQTESWCLRVRKRSIFI